MTGNMRVLLLNNDEALSNYIRQKLIDHGGYSVSCESSINYAMDLLKCGSFDIVIVKFGMPDTDGLSLVRSVKTIAPDCVIIALVEGGTDPSLLKEIQQLGAFDFISQPINLDKLLFLMKKGIELRALMLGHRKLVDGLKEHNISLSKQNTLLAKRVEESTKNLTKLYEDLRETYMRTIKVLAQAIDARDHYTHSHSENVARYAVAIAEELGMSSHEIELVRDACELHDLGKIGVQDCILGKASSLTKQEWEQIRRHPETAAHILEPLTFLNGVIELVKQHHEHFDGSGYPQGLKAEGILLGARIIHVADAYEAMRSPRSYRLVPLSRQEAVTEIIRNRGTQFDPKVVDAFLKVVDRL